MDSASVLGFWTLLGVSALSIATPVLGVLLDLKKNLLKLKCLERI